MSRLLSIGLRPAEADPASELIRFTAGSVWHQAMEDELANCLSRRARPEVTQPDRAVVAAASRGI